MHLLVVWLAAVLFSVNGDVRIIYKELSDRYIFIDVGTHAQVY